MPVPNQLITKTKKNKPQKDFLLISNREWIAASKKLSPSAFQMYLWLIRHDESFNNELSKQAFMNDFDCKESTYKRAWKELKDLGYAIQKEEGSNIYYIYSSPCGDGVKNEPINNGIKNEPKTGSKMNPIRVKNEPNMGSKMNIEIDNIDNINNNRQDGLNQQRDGLSAETAILMTKEEILNTYNPNALRKITSSAIGNTRFLINGKFIEMVLQ